MKRHLIAAAALVAALPLSCLPLPSSGAEAGRPSTYVLTGDADGSKFEGMASDQRSGTFYVSEVTGGEIHRGYAGTERTHEWLGGMGTDGRFTARGMTVDRAGNVYIAGGPNGIDSVISTDNGRPDLWIYAPTGELLAALRAPGDGAFLNDVVIGVDGAAYFTNSAEPQVFRVAEGDSGWGIELWSDATGSVATLPSFNLGGLVLTADRSALIVAQGTTGQLWRFDSEDGSVSLVDSGGADLVSADGLVRQGGTLTVVRNFPRMIAKLRLSSDGRRASVTSQAATDPTRVLTTASVLRGRILFVDSKFDESVAAPPYEVITLPYTF